MYAADTIVALATPTGTSAIALLRISGPLSGRLAEEITKKPRKVRAAMRADYRATDGRLVDDVLLTFFEGPNSYTGEDTCEISTHGNPLIVQMILADLTQRGCRLAEPGEFTQRTFLNGKMDLSQAEAVMDVIHAGSERALAAAHDQLRGSLGRKITGLVDRLLTSIAHVEAYIDFPDEDLPTEDRERLKMQLTALASDISQLAATNRYGNILRDGLRTVLVGLPNAGKSSLLNRLVGSDRALVSPEPGTTRDYLEERVRVGTHLVRYIDTAGLNPAPSELERLGMQKTLQQIEDAHLLLFIVDGTKELDISHNILHQRLKSNDTILVVNKSDLGSKPFLSTGKIVNVSARTGEGVEELAKEICKFAERFNQDQGSETVAISARHADALRTAGESLDEALRKTEAGQPDELMAGDLRAVLYSLGEITGRVDNEQMLDRLFCHFCIGK